MVMQQAEVKPMCGRLDDAHAYQVMIAVFDRQLQKTLRKQLHRCLIGKVCICDNGELPDNLAMSDPAAVFVCVDGEGSGQIARARKNGYSGLVIAVTSEAGWGAAKEVIRSGADQVLFMPAKDIEFDILAERIRMGAQSVPSTVELFKKFLGPIGQGVVLFDGKEELLFANKSAMDILSVASEKEAAGLIERNCSKGFFEKSRLDQSAITYIDVKLPGAEVRKLMGLEICHLELSGDFPVYMVMLHDFSEWKKLDELRSSFVTSLSHRMRTPLTSIRNVVKILSGNDQPVGSREKEKLLNIGWRNVEKMISNLDELQKVFMIESEELNVCRTMIRVKNEIEPVFEQLQKQKKIRGFKLSVPDIAIFTGGGRLKDLIASVVDAYHVWLAEKPFIECSSSVRTEGDLPGIARKKLSIYLRPRENGWKKTSRNSFKDFLSFHEAHRGLVLERLATALNGNLDISTGNTITLSIPLDSQFNRDKDLVHPLHMMIERADIAGSQFSLIDLSMNGENRDDSVYINLIERILLHHIRECGVVSRGENRSSYSLFVTGMNANEVDSLMHEIREQFLGTCLESGDDEFPSLRWEIKYSRAPGSSESVIDNILSATLV